MSDQWTTSLLPQQLRHWWHGIRARRRAAEFATILAGARRLANDHPPALADLIRLLGRQVQGYWMALPVRYHTPGACPELRMDTLLFARDVMLTVDGQRWDNVVTQLADPPLVELRKDLVFTAPWHPERLRDALATIGTGKGRGPWRADDNHRIEYWYPMGVSWVTVSGNHSIMAGIVQGEGTVRPQVAYDLRPLYQHVYSDGVFYRRSQDQTIISPVMQLEMAAIFEIGRMMDPLPTPGAGSG